MSNKSSKFTPLTFSSVLAGLRMGMPMNQAAAAAGISPSTLKNWINEEEGVADAVMQAEADFTFKHVKNLDDQAMEGGRGSAAISQWLLERRDPANWGRSTRNDMWTRDQMVKAMVEQFKHEGLTDVTEDVIWKEIADAEKQALPPGKKT